MSFKFGDVIANGYMSEDNPYYKSIFLRKTKKFIHVMELDGRLSEYYNDKNNKLVKVGSVINESEMARFKEEMRMKKRDRRNKR